MKLSIKISFLVLAILLGNSLVIKPTYADEHPELYFENTCTECVQFIEKIKESGVKDASEVEIININGDDKNLRRYSVIQDKCGIEDVNPIPLFYYENECELKISQIEMILTAKANKELSEENDTEIEEEIELIETKKKNDFNVSASMLFFMIIIPSLFLGIGYILITRFFVEQPTKSETKQDKSIKKKTKKK